MSSLETDAFPADGRWPKKRLKYLIREVDQRAGGTDALPLFAVSLHFGVRRSTELSRAEDFSRYKVCLRGDVVLNRMRAFQGALGLAGEAGFVSPDYAVLRSLDGLSARFLSYLLRSRWGTAEMTSRIRGIGGTDAGNVRTPRLNVEDLKDIHAVIPGVPEQEAVADFLDRECARIAELSGELSALAASLAAQQSEHVSRQLYGRPLVPLRYRLASIEQGWSPQCEDRLADPGEWGVLKVGCVNYGQFRPLEHKRLPDDLEPRPATEIREGDVLMSRANTRELVGSAALVSDTAGRRLMLCDKLYRLSPTPRTNPGFLVIVLCSREVRDQIEVATTGASGSMQNISQPLIRSLSVPDCDPAEQPTFVEEFHRMAVAYRAAIDETEAIAIDLAEYRDALITEAVTGQLDIARLSETQMDESLDAVREGERPGVLAS